MSDELNDKVNYELGWQIDEALRAPHPDAKKFMDHTNDAGPYTTGYKKGKAEKKDALDCKCPCCRSERGETLSFKDCHGLTFQYKKMDFVLKAMDEHGIELNDEEREGREMILADMERIKLVLLKHGITV